MATSAQENGGIWSNYCNYCLHLVCRVGVGASSGIGAGVALEFASKCFSIAINGRNVEQLQTVMEKCVKETKLPQEKVLMLPGDISKENAVKSIVNKTIATFGGLDILINNAGILTESSMENCDMDKYELTMDTNLKSAVMMTKYAVPHLIKSKGCIVNVSSISGIRPMSGVLFYACSKAAMDQFTKCTAVELAPNGIRVNSVNPGVIKTNVHLNAGYSKEKYEEYLKIQPLLHPIGRYGEVEDVTKAIAFLTSEEAAFITGTILPIDGGRICVTPRQSMVPQSKV